MFVVDVSRRVRFVRAVYFEPYCEKARLIGKERSMPNVRRGRPRMLKNG